MKTLVSLFVGIVIGFALGCYWSEHPSQAARARADFQQSTTNVSESLKKTFNVANLKDEMERTGKVVREKAVEAGHAIADSAANARITTDIKARLIKDSGLSAFKISVDTTDGLVTLSGTVPTYDAVARAMSIAMEVDDVHRVISTLQVKPAPDGAETPAVQTR